MTIYLDCNATTPIDPAVREIVLRYFDDEYGNAGSRTHEFGARAQQAVQRARDQIASVVSAKRDEVTFTSGATESNNLAILGLASHAAKMGRKHVVTTAIEHKAVLEPFEVLRGRGFDVTIVGVGSSGTVDPDEIRRALRPDTSLVSMMHVNNETGVVQPIDDVVQALSSHEAFLHVDAAQGFGKQLDSLRSPRIDLVSISGHKIYAPKGVGALIARRRGYKRPPLEPLMFGGGQEKGLRPGTLAVPLIVGLGLAAELAEKHQAERRAATERIRDAALAALEPLLPQIHGDPSKTMPHVLNVAFPGLDSEAVMVALKHIVAVSNGSACTSHSYQPSHVLIAMGLPDASIHGAVRMSWCHLTPTIDWNRVRDALEPLRSERS